MIVRSNKNAAEIVNKKFHLEECRHIDLDEGANMMKVPGPGRLTLAGTGLVNATDAPKQARSTRNAVRRDVDREDEVQRPQRRVRRQGRLGAGLATTANRSRSSSINEIDCQFMTVTFKERLSVQGRQDAEPQDGSPQGRVRPGRQSHRSRLPPAARQGTRPTEDLFRYSQIVAKSLNFDNDQPRRRRKRAERRGDVLRTRQTDDGRRRQNQSADAAVRLARTSTSAR